MSKQKSLADYDAQIKALQEKRRAFQIAERKRIADETKRNETERNALLYEAMFDFLQSRHLTTENILSMTTAELKAHIFNQPEHHESY